MMGDERHDETVRSLLDNAEEKAAGSVTYQGETFENDTKKAPDTTSNCGSPKTNSGATLEVRAEEAVSMAGAEHTSEGHCGASIGFEYNFYPHPYEVFNAYREFNKNEDITFITRGCKWSPDGTCLLANSDEKLVKLFDLPKEFYNVKPGQPDTWRFSETGSSKINKSLEIRESELIYDFTWYPMMNSQKAETCCFATTARRNPIHLWDAYTGELRCSYIPHNHLDELDPAHSLCFSPSGEKLYCGSNKTIKIFNVSDPGKNCVTRNLKAPQDSESPGQVGIISSICFNPSMHSVYAAGSYLKSIGLYSEPEGKLLCLLEGQSGGLTHMIFSYDGSKLFSGGRKDSEIICWDIRNPGSILFVLYRDVLTNQRIYFDIDSTGKYLVSGNSNGYVRVWDLTKPPNTEGVPEPFIEPIEDFSAHRDCCNGVSLHPYLPILATSSGQRHFPDVMAEDSDSEEFDSDGESRPKIRKVEEDNSYPPSSDPLAKDKNGSNSQIKARPMTRRRYVEERENSLKLFWAGGKIRQW